MAGTRREDKGVTSNDAIHGSELYIITAFISLALYNVLELTVLIFATFKRRGGVYFWAMVVATWGVAFNAVGYLLKFLQPDARASLGALYTVLVLAGWSAMVTGQSAVLYSRLHLLAHDRLTLRLVLAMIVADALACHPPTAALFALVNNAADPARYAAAYSALEKAQLFVFFVQEFVISTVYVVASARFLRSRAGLGGGSAGGPGGAQAAGGATGAGAGGGLTDSGRMTMYWLIAVNVVVVLLDVSILALEFSGFYDLQTSWKAFVYSTKLKLEFSILNKLIKVVKTRNPDLFDSDGVKLRSLGGRSDSARNMRLTYRSSRTRQGKDGDVSQDGVQVLLPSDARLSDTPSLSPVQRTKDRTSSFFSHSESQYQGTGRIQNRFSLTRSS